MSESDTPGVGDDQLRMRLYELLHEQARTERKWQFWRLAAGHLVIGVIIAYAFVFDQWRFIALTPVLYGVVVMDGLKYGVRLLYLQRHLVALEAKLAEREPLFEWVSEYGFFGAGRRLDVEDIDEIPEVAQFALIGAIYLALVAASLLVWTSSDVPVTAAGFSLAPWFLLVGYGVFTALVAAIGFVGYLHYRRVRDDVARLAGSNPE